MAIKFNNGDNQLQFYASSYDLSGRFIDLEPFELSKIDLCYIQAPFTSSQKNLLPFTTTNIYHTCSLKISDLLRYSDSKSTIFYDLYVRYGNGFNMYPVPVKVYQSSDDYPIQRRLFLTDTVSSKSKSDQPSLYVRYAKAIKLSIELMPSKSDGEIYPPVFFVDYGYALRSDVNKTVDISFEIEYKMDVKLQYLVLFIIIGVLSGLALVWSCFRLWSWNRRSGRFMCDIVALLKFVMFLVGSVGNILFYTLVGWSLYWLIFYRGQSVAFLFLPLKSQESVFTTFVIVGFVLKLLDVVYLILVQTSYDIFFVDWERPQIKDSDKDLIKSNFIRLPPIQQEKEKEKEKNAANAEQVNAREIARQNTVSCWRTLFVANEWNELQTYRKINPTFQLAFVLLLLNVVNLEALALRDIGSDLVRNPNGYVAPYSSVLRLAIAASLYLALGIYFVQIVNKN